MKRKLFTAIALIFSVVSANAQGAIEAYQFSKKDLRGTARSMSLGGAMGARGGDVSAISINPAGIGMYRGSEIVITLDLQNVESKSEFTNAPTGIFKDKKFSAGFNNMAFVASLPVYNDVVPAVNFGFSYNKLLNFNKKYNMSGENLSRNLTDYMADRANAGNRAPSQINLNDKNAVAREDIWRTEDWLPVFGYSSWLLGYQSGKYVTFDNNDRLYSANDLYVEEKGSINTYDFNVGADFADIISAGLTLSVTDIDYRMSSLYVEDFRKKIGGEDVWNGYDLANNLKTEGTGWKLGVGIIFKPTDELRIGVAYHSPTWYDMTDFSYAQLDHDLTNLADAGIPLLDDYPDGGQRIKSMEGYDSRYEYRLRTPDRWVFSIAGAIGNVANVSLDYELNDYSKTKFKDRDGFGPASELTESYTKEFYRLTSTVRAGVEVSFTPLFFGRVGYSWQQSPYNKAFERYLDPTVNTQYNFDTPGSTHHYLVEKDANYITWGLGYRLTRNIYTDLGFVYKNQKADLYAFSRSDKTKMTFNTFQGALTMGVRF